MNRKVEVEFKGAVFSVHVLVGGHEVEIAKDFAEDKWTGSADLDPAGDTVRIELQFIAPSFTDWELTVEIDDEEVLSESDRSDEPLFTFTKEVTLAET